MTLKQAKARGFTIVELLIVIVVIAILAAITIVAYNGIQNRAKESAAQSLANNVAKKAEAYNTASTAGNYPANLAAFATVDVSKLDDTSVVIDGTAFPTTEKQVTYKKCTTGAAIYWKDSVSGFVNTVGLGGYASVPNATANPTICT